MERWYEMRLINTKKEKGNLFAVSQYQFLCESSRDKF